ncbi:helix-turn-helix domain-containing protein [Actinomadura sp. 7K507]|uniref:helix-turn-helix domain-containing protein n=1 Tax=Actinomadura sp. 7K507 TaxID=2530365 RepID=UPI0010473D59|nr:helix-turn-helix domain-containing protein [Actinomadura sp. 7K507]TDC79883.1 XRE family transcriptional regulator [Actinomadura sp. 7K507]
MRAIVLFVDPGGRADTNTEDTALAEHVTPHWSAVQLGDRVRTLRHQRDMSQAQLAGRDLSDSYISLIESGRRTPSPTVLGALADRLDCSTDYLRHGITETTLNDLNTRHSTARRALYAGHPQQALPELIDLVASHDLRALPELHAEVVCTAALALESRGRFGEAITMLDRLPDVRVAQVDETADSPGSAVLRPRPAHGQGSGPGTLSGSPPPQIGWERWATAQVALARCHRRGGHAQRAARTAQAAFTVAATAADQNDVRATEAAVQIGGGLAEAFSDAGELLLARQTCARLVRLAEHSGHPAARLLAYQHTVQATEALGDLEEAAHWADRALQLLENDENLRAAIDLRTRCAALLLRVRPAQAERARNLLTQQLTRTALLGGTTQALADLAEAELLLDHPEQAAAHAREALQGADTDHLGGKADAPADDARTPGRPGTDRATAQALAVLADACARLGDPDEAITALVHRAELLEGHGPSRQAAQAWAQAAHLLDTRANHLSDHDQRRRARFYRRALAAIGVHPHD